MILAGGLALLCGCGAGATLSDSPTTTAPTGTDDALYLNFDNSYVDVGGVVPGAANVGTSAIRTKVSTLAGGRIRQADGRDSGFALRFPAYAASPPEPAAALLVWSTGATDTLDPGTGAFSFGADFSLDAVSSGSATDNGDNLVQRGLFLTGPQYKIQVDHDVASCRIAGSEGDAFVKSSTPVLPGHWYRLTCSRSGNAVIMSLTDLSATNATPQETEVTAPTGAVSFARTLPLAIACKVDPDGVIAASATDQFNGLVDNVFFQRTP